MVGTKAMVSPAIRQPCTSARRSAMRFSVRIGRESGGGVRVQKQCSGAG